MERKIGSGRKGTVDEEEYLLKSVSKLVEKFAVTKGMLLLVVIELDGKNSDHLFRHAKARYAVCCHTCSNSQTNTARKG